MSVYVSYSDESDPGDGQGHFFIGGYVARETDWPGFSRRWVSEVLQPYPSIPYVHMVDLRSNRWREERGICRTQAYDKLQTAADVISASTFLRPFVGRVNQSEYRDACQTVASKGYEFNRYADAIDFPCYITYAYIMLLDLEKDPNVEKVNFMASRKGHLSDLLQKVFKDSMQAVFEERDMLKHAAMVGDFIPLSMEDHMPLQAADVLSWHMRRYLCDAMKEDEDFKIAKKLDNGNIRHLHMPKEMLEDFCLNLREGDSDE